MAKFKIERDPDCDATLDGFAAEAWYQASYFRSGEMRMFGEDGDLPTRYLRTYLGQCNLISTTKPKSTVLLYPVLIIYESGVVLLELRTIAPRSPTRLRQFVARSVNLAQFSFEFVEAPPGLVKLATQAYYHSYRKWSIFYRLALVWLQRGHDKAVRQMTRHHKEGDFGFDLAQMSAEDSKRSEKLSTFALTVFQTAAFVIGRPRSSLGFLLRGQKRTPQLGDFWSGRPHIYLIRFEDQCDTALENEHRHKTAFGSILLRVPEPDPAVANQYLPKDRRLFDDYNSYIKSAASLWVWSKSGIDGQQEWKDANRGHLIYEHQAVVELLEYGHILYRSLLDRAAGYGSLGVCV